MGTDSVKAGMVIELETAERIAKVRRLMNHPNIVSVLKVPRNAMIIVPSTRQQGVFPLSSSIRHFVLTLPVPGLEAGK